ncbi:MAG TPA: hypothetical protein VLE99_03520 [Candidatus Saccharimonadales bacterium]|nr:hypothetical protein [Candidatus Saccharimonadales bacterium]
MILSSEVFSLRDINPDEAQLFKLLFGGERPDADLIHSFAELDGRPLIRARAELICYLGVARGAIDATVDPAASRAFDFGAYMYAATFGWLNRADKLPATDGAIARAGNREAATFIVDAASGIHDAPAFCDILNRAAGATGVARRYEEVMHVGAGALHLLVHAAIEPSDGLSVYEYDPTLADLRELFRELGEGS